MTEHEGFREVISASGNYHYVDKYEVHICKEFQDLNMIDVEIWIWKQSGQAQIIIAQRSCPITFCPFCGKKISK